MLQTRPQLATDPPPPPPPRAGLPCISPISPYISLQAVPHLSLLSDDFYQAAYPNPNPNPNPKRLTLTLTLSAGRTSSSAASSMRCTSAESTMYT